MCAWFGGVEGDMLNKYAAYGGSLSPSVLSHSTSTHFYQVQLSQARTASQDSARLLQDKVKQV